MKVKYNVSQLKPYVVPSEEKSADTIGTTEIIESEDEFNDEKPSKSALEEFNTSESCNGVNFWNVLPDKLMEKILFCAIEESGYTTPGHKGQTNQSILKTSKRFQIIENRGTFLLPRIYINPSDFLPEAAYKGKIKVSVRKITSAFGSSSSVALQISNFVGRKCKSDWLILSPQKHSWFTIDRLYWKGNRKAMEISDDSNSSKVWLKTTDYLLTEKEKNILLSDTEWLNDNIMDAAQKLICKALSLESYQSVLNWQKRGTPFFEVGEEHIQLMHDGVKRWLLSFNSNGRVQVCDSRHTNLTQVTKNC